MKSHKHLEQVHPGHSILPQRSKLNVEYATQDFQQTKSDLGVKSQTMRNGSACAEFQILLVIPYAADAVNLKILQTAGHVCFVHS